MKIMVMRGHCGALHADAGSYTSHKVAIVNKMHAGLRGVSRPGWRLLARVRAISQQASWSEGKLAPYLCSFQQGLALLMHTMPWLMRVGSCLRWYPAAQLDGRIAPQLPLLAQGEFYQEKPTASSIKELQEHLGARWKLQADVRRLQAVLGLSSLTAFGSCQQRHQRMLQLAGYAQGKDTALVLQLYRLRSVRCSKSTTRNSPVLLIFRKGVTLFQKLIVA